MPIDSRMNIRVKKCLAVLLLLVIALLVLVAIRTRAFSDDKKITDGTLDLTNWDQSTLIPLTGEWDFYWGKFLSHENIEQKPTLEAEIPSGWNRYELDGEQIPDTGFATYRLHVTGATIGQELSLKLYPIIFAYKLYIDNELMVSAGQLSTTENGYESEEITQTATFTPKNESFDIILWVSNFSLASGGMKYTPFIGTSDRINLLNTLLQCINILIMGMLLILAFNLTFYCILRKDLSIIPMMVMCALVVLKLDFDQTHLISFFFAQVKAESMVKFRYLFIVWVPSCLLLSLYLNYPMLVKKLTMIVVICYFAVATVLIVVYPAEVVSSFLNAITIIAALIALFVVIKLGMLLKAPSCDIVLFFVGTVALFLAMVRDMLAFANVIKASNILFLPLGFLIMILFYNLAYNIRYEFYARDRERALKELNEAIERESKIELKFLKSQIQPHFINNTLTAINSINRTDLEKGRALLVDFSRYLSSAYELWNMNDVEPIEKELAFIHSYVNLQRARYEDRLNVVFDIDEVSINIPSLVIQPLVENSINHGINFKKEGITITVYVKDLADAVKVGVKDTGRGITKEKSLELLENNNGSEGTGIYNVNRRLRKVLNVSLNIETPDEGGTDIYMIIPKNNADENEPTYK